MTMHEMCSFFMGTLGTLYIGRMAGIAYKDFREVMDVGDRIEMLTKAGKLSIGEGDNNGNKKSVPPRKKENENGRFYRPLDGEVRKIAKNMGGEDGLMEEVTEKEEDEFLKIMRQSEYDVVEQLRKTHSKISLLGLVMSSDLHRKALLKMLNEAYVNPDVTPHKMVNMIDPVKHVNMITFFDEEMVRQLEKVPRALLTTAKCRGHIVGKILIDGGSALNIMPLSTLMSIEIKRYGIVPRKMIVYAFDGNKHTRGDNIAFGNRAYHLSGAIYINGHGLLIYNVAGKDDDDFLHNFEVVETQQLEGIGHMHEGTQSFVSVLEKFDRFGQGYEVPQEDKNKYLTRRKKCGGILENPIPHINESFTGPVGVISPDNLVEPYIHFSANSLEEVDAPGTSNIHIDENDTPLRN
ncbi:hypothetical protein Lal_00034019 [Lupinus albus]|nr:hypothetical protein Lal_00034019 [Lupinus albus]